MFRRIASCLIILSALCGSAFAQSSTTRAAMQALKTATIVPNTVGAITPEILNTMLGEMIASMVTQSDTTNTFASPPTFTGQNGVCMANGSSPITCSTGNNSITISGVVCALGGSCTITPTAANVSFTQAFSGAVATNLDTINKARPLYATDYMTAEQIADGTSFTSSIDVSGAINTCIADGILNRKNCYLPAGGWLASGAQLVMNYAPNLSYGIFFFGDGESTVLNMRTNVAAPAFLIKASGGTPGVPVSAVYGGVMRIHINCAAAGPCLQDGQADFSDYMNQQTFMNVSVQNFNATSSSNCYQFNAVYSPNAISVNCASAAGPTGGNDLFQFRKVSFGYWNIGGSNGQTWLHITSDVSAGNTFVASDCEVVQVCLAIDTANGVDNTFYGGTFSWNWDSTGAVGVDASAGGNNAFFYPNKNPDATTGAAGAFISGGTGTRVVEWNTSTIARLASPTFTGTVTTAALTAAGAFAANSTVHLGGLTTGVVTYALCLTSGGDMILKGSNCF